METTHLVSVREYLATSYRPDVDYVEGQLEERNLGERDHSDLQTFFTNFFGSHQRLWSLTVHTELRIQVRASRFRVPDVCLLAADAPREQIVRTAPLLCIEILSPADSVSRMRERVRDFLDMGVREVWLADPLSRSVILCSGNTMVEQASGTLTLSGTDIRVPLTDVFAVLD